MSIKEQILIPVYWGEWWVTSRGNPYDWAEVNEPMTRVVSGRY